VHKIRWFCIQLCKENISVSSDEVNVSYSCIYLETLALGLVQQCIPLYEGESVNRPQMDIKRKTCDIRTWQKNYFSTYPPPTLMHLSHRFTIASKPAAQIREFLVSSAREAVKIEPERVKLKNLHC
jgi:hypothetical protein